MLSRDEQFDRPVKDKGQVLKGILNSKENIMKKKNSEIENRLFNKTTYYVIAVGTRSSASDEDLSKVRAYIYYNGNICFYSPQGKAYNKREYAGYIDFVKHAVESGKFEWTDFWINKGDIIKRDKGNNILVEKELINPIKPASGLVGNVSELSVKLFYDFLKSVNQDDETKMEALKVSYDKGILNERVERIVKNIQNKKLIDKDGEIIVRTKIEGYNYISSYVKSVLNSEFTEKYDIINAFFSRVFFLEMHGYIQTEE